MFKKTRKSPVSTCLQDSVTASYKDLVKVLGEPNGDSDGYKVSTEWLFENNKGQIVTLYDYEETDLYSSENPSVEKFRARKSYDWHIGAHTEEQAKEFRLWLKERLAHIDDLD